MFAPRSSWQGGLRHTEHARLAPCTAMATGTQSDTWPHHSPAAHGSVGSQHRGQTDFTFHPPHACTHTPSKYKLGHTIQLSQVAHPLLLRSVLAANTKDARYNLLLQQLPSVLLTYESIPSIILLPAVETLSPANHSNALPQSCPHSSRWLGQLCPSLSPQPVPSPSPSPRMATTEHSSFPGSWEDGKRRK